MKPPVDAPTSRQTIRLRRSQMIQRARQLIAAAADVRHALEQLHPRIRGHAVAWLVAPSAHSTMHLPGDDQRLRLFARLRQPAFDQQLIEADLGGVASSRIRSCVARRTTRSASSRRPLARDRRKVSGPMGGQPLLLRPFRASVSIP